MSDHDTHSSPAVICRFRKVLFDTRGVVLLEYSILVGTVALACAVGLLVVGTAVLNSFGFVRELLLSAMP